VTFTFELDLRRFKINQPARCLGQQAFYVESYCLDMQTNTHRTNCFIWTTKERLLDFKTFFSPPCIFGQRL